ncbi:MAG: hypothetical protein ACPLRW_07935 [Moorellales bacterium]
MKLRFVRYSSIDAFEGAFVARRREGNALILDQLYCPLPGQGRMTAIMRRYLHRLPETITTVWVQAHPYRCEDGLHWREVIRFARWLRHLGFRFQDRHEFFRRLRQIVSEWDGYVRYGAIQDQAWMVLER